MSDYMLSCCSSADVTYEWLKSRDIPAALFNFELGGVWHKDDFGETVAPAQLYRRMLAGEQATTSQVSVGDYIEFFRAALDEGKDIVHVTLSGGLSRTYDAANLAADQLAQEYPERSIHIVDSLCASSGYGLLMDRLASLKRAGMGAAELAEWARLHRLEVNHLFLSSDLTFFVRGGRISPIAGTMGNILKICPLMHVASDGTLQVKEKIRTKSRTKRRIVERMIELAEGGLNYAGTVYLSQSECMDDARDVARAIVDTFPNVTDDMVHIFDIGATIGCHTGPGTIALFFWGSPERW